MIEQYFEKFKDAEQIFFTGYCMIRGSDYTRKIKMVNGKWHNLSGPACVYYYDFGKHEDYSQYFINDFGILIHWFKSFLLIPSLTYDSR